MPSEPKGIAMEPVPELVAQSQRLLDRAITLRRILVVMLATTVAGMVGLSLWGVYNTGQKRKVAVLLSEARAEGWKFGWDEAMAYSRRPMRAVYRPLTTSAR